MSTTSHILSLLVEERTRLQAAIDALKGEPEHGLPDWVKGTLSRSEQMKENWRKRKAAQAAVVATPASAPNAKPVKRTMSEEGRQRIIAATKARWARINAAKAEVAAPKKKSAKAAIAEAIAPKEDAEFKARMSAAMKKAWAKRKRTAKKKAGV